jgi:hypothetical protein
VTSFSAYETSAKKVSWKLRSGFPYRHAKIDKAFLPLVMELGGRNILGFQLKLPAGILPRKRD